jgi:hypothetical protein
MPKEKTPMIFKYRLKQEIYDYLVKKRLTYGEVAEELSFKSRQGLRDWICSQKRCRALDVQFNFEKMKARHLAEEAEHEEELIKQPEPVEDILEDYNEKED